MFLLSTFIHVAQDIKWGLIFEEKTLVFVQEATIAPAQAAKPQEEAKIEATEEMQGVWVTTYNAEEGQTDSSPQTMANGKRVYEGAIASNCHPFGTVIELKGLGKFVVEDRMNSRFTDQCGKPVVKDESGRYVSGEKADVFKWERSDNFSKASEYSVK